MRRPRRARDAGLRPASHVALGATPASAAVAAVALLVLATGCGTSVTVARLHARPGSRPVLVTTGDAPVPYQSLGLVQLQRTGFIWAGWVEAPDTSLETTLNDYLVPEAERRGADAVIHLRFETSQYSTVTRVICMLPPLFLVPLLPATTTLQGELVKYTLMPGTAPTKPAP